MEGDLATGALLGGIDDASVEGARIHVQADGALVEVTRIEDAVNWLERIDGAGMSQIHLDGFGGFDMAFAGCNILMHDMKVFNEQAADGDGHPAILVAVVVDRTGLADFPADGNQFVERCFIDEVAGVVLAVPGEIGRERVGIQRGVLQKSSQGFDFVKC